MKRYVLEFLGTFFVTLAISLTENPMTIGLVYLAMLYIGARVSGAHYNPSITIAMWLRGTFATHRVGWYILSQILGAAAALIFEFKFSGALFTPDIASSDQLFFLCAFELLFAGILCYLYIATHSITPLAHTQLYGIILGLTVIGLASMGVLFNAAISVASLILHMLLHGEMQIHLLYTLLVYVVSPLLGGCLAGFAFDYLEAPAQGEFLNVDGKRK